jgi:hypothetical protein
MKNMQSRMAGTTMRSAQNNRTKRPSGVSSRPTTPQPAVSQATKNSVETNDTDNLLECTMAAKEYLQKHSLIIHSALLTLEALRYAILHT